MKKLLMAGMAAALLATGAAAQDYAVRLIHFTDDGTESGTMLLPGFRHHSCWSGLGVNGDGDVYIGASNHYQPEDTDGDYGNVAMYKLPEGDSVFTLLGDLRSISTAQGNWHADESQHKVHSFIQEQADGKMWFATLDYNPSYYNRGAHMYYVDPATDTIVDYSALQDSVMKRDFTVIANEKNLSDTAGVFIQYYGIKNISLNKNAPDVIYAMTYEQTGEPRNWTKEPGHIIRFTISTGSMEKIDESDGIPYVMYTDNSGNLFYVNDDGYINKYELATGTISRVSSTPTNGWGMVAPTASGDTVYVVTYSAKVIYRLICATGQVDMVSAGKICGPNFWQFYNITLSRDGKTIYYVSNNNDAISKSLRRVDVASGACEKLMDISSVTGPDRTLAFGGVGIWDKHDNFYVPVFNNTTTSNDLALMRVHVKDAGTGGLHAPQTARAAGTDMRIWPQPVRERAVFEFALRHHMDGAPLMISDVHGRLVAACPKNPVSNRFEWNGTRTDGSPAPAGVYSYTVSVDGQPHHGRIMKVQ